MYYYNQRVQNTSCVFRVRWCLLASHCQFCHILKARRAHATQIQFTFIFPEFSLASMFIHSIVYFLPWQWIRTRAEGNRRKLYLWKNAVAVEAYANAFPSIQWMMLVVMTIATSPALRSAPTQHIHAPTVMCCVSCIWSKLLGLLLSRYAIYFSRARVRAPAPVHDRMSMAEPNRILINWKSQWVYYYYTTK